MIVLGNAAVSVFVSGIRIQFDGAVVLRYGTVVILLLLEFIASLHAV